MIYSKKKYIGILGGTFDPPHSGHILISKNALIRLGLGEVWWVVTNNNPLKNSRRDYIDRVAEVKNILRFKKIKMLEVNDKKINSQTYELVIYLKKKFPKKKFIWLMGVDNLEKFHLWKNWRKIFYNIPIAIFDRPFYSLNIVKSKALGFFRNKRIKTKTSLIFKKLNPPRWIFLYGMTSLKSSSKIRSSKNE